MDWFDDLMSRFIKVMKLRIPNPINNSDKSVKHIGFFIFIVNVVGN